jgi:general secretion pathway protein D
MGSARKQVLIEATIVEVRLNDSYQAGIDWSRLNNGPGNSGFVFGQRLGSRGFNFNPSTGAVTQGDSNALGTAATAGLFAGYLNPASAIGNIAASLTLLKQFGDTKVLSSPKLMVLNNQTAVLKVVDNLVYFTVQAQQSQAAVGGGVLSTITTTPNTVPVGVVMSVTPQINDTGNVNINVRPTISRVLSFVRDPNPQLLAIPSQIPQIQVREMESILQISSGNTAVLGGLMQDEIQRNSDKVPGLSEIPGVGKIFTGKNDASQKTELVIFLRPTVIPSASLESDELQAYKRYLPAQQLQNVLEDAN